MRERIHPLSGMLDPRPRRAPEGRTGIRFAERRPGSICDIACWPNSREAFGKALQPILGTLPAAGRARFDAGTCVLGLSPGRWQAISPRSDVPPRVETVLMPQAGTVVDLTDARAGLRVTGPDAEAVLQKALSFDLDSRAFPAGAVAQSGIHHMSATVVRLDQMSFDVFVFRAFAVSLWEWAGDAAFEFGWETIDPVD